MWLFACVLAASAAAAHAQRAACNVTLERALATAPPLVETLAGECVPAALCQVRARLAVRPLAAHARAQHAFYRGESRSAFNGSAVAVRAAGCGEARGCCVRRKACATHLSENTANDTLQRGLCALPALCGGAAAAAAGSNLECGNANVPALCCVGPVDQPLYPPIVAVSASASSATRGATSATAVRASTRAGGEPEATPPINAILVFVIIGLAVLVIFLTVVFVVVRHRAQRSAGAVRQSRNDIPVDEVYQPHMLPPDEPFDATVADARPPSPPPANPAMYGEVPRKPTAVARVRAINDNHEGYDRCVVLLP